ncbi:hypothetical protein HYT23_03490 [Candidatus Pacearchaeota archaeon]|nr:hypothetical protein [Candidatus Pacearchaeota archaeon]
MALKKILATSWHPRGANAIIPIVKKLNLEGKTELVVIGHGFSEKRFDDAGIPYRKISDYGLSDVSLSSMERLLLNEEPDLVLTGTSTQDENNKDVIEQTITLESANNQIPSLAVLDYWANYWQRFSDVANGNKFAFLPSKIAVIDEYAKRAMIGEGFPEERLVITGNPHFDSFESKAKGFSETDRKKIREEIGLPQEILLFYAGGIFQRDSSAYGFWDLDNIKMIKETISKSNKAGLAVKLHPRVPAEDFKEINNYAINHGKGKIKLVSDVSPNHLSLASDVTLTACSTVGIEAVLMGKPCVSLQPNLQCEDYFSILTRNGLVPVGYDAYECKSLIENVVSDKNYREIILPKMASGFKVYGKATGRVVGLVYSMI